MARRRGSRGKGGKIVNSFVKHGHKGRHPGFSVSTFPAKGARRKLPRKA